MKINFNLNKLFNNDKFVLLFSFCVSVLIWLAVVINVSPATTRVIKDVKVVIDNTVPSQFGLEVFGESEFTVDVTVKGKKYLISPATLSADDIVVTAQTSSVDSAGKRTLQLKAESASGRTDYSIASVSMKTIEVYFDIAKTIQMVIEPNVIADGFSVVREGYTCGDINLSETSVTITGPSTEINRVEKVVAELVLTKPLSSNKSARAEVVPVDDSGKTNFKYLTMSVDDVVLTIPVLQVKELDTVITFKNAPDNYVITPLEYTVSPVKDEFNISVDDYEKTSTFNIGTVDFKQLSPSNHVFTFLKSDLGNAYADDSTEYTVNVKMTGISQEYFTIAEENFTLNNPEKINYKVSGLNKAVVIVGAPKDLESLTEENITVEIDLSNTGIEKGQTVTVPAVVSVNSQSCWVYGTYSVEVSL